MPSRNARNMLLLHSGGAQTYAQKVLSYSPTEFWMLDETSGTVAAAQLDASKNGTYGGSLTLNGLTFLDGRPAPTFDGTNDEVNLLTAALQAAWSGTQGAMSIWLYDTDGTAGTLRVCAALGDTDAAQYAKVYKATTHRADVLKNTNREAQVARVTSTWRHIFISWNNTGNIARMVIDGVDTVPNVTTLANTGSLNHAWVGRRVDGRFWLGGLARFAYWNTVQTVATGQALAVVG